LYADVHMELLSRGYMLAPSAYEIGFLSTSHEESHIMGFVQALDDSLTSLERSS
jgi:glutamate-1-semialdehyde aminotransferase